MAPRSQPWTTDEMARLVAVTLASAVGSVAAWYVASGQAEFRGQSGAMTLTIASLLLYGYGNTMWLLRGLRATAERRRRLVARLQHLDGADEPVEVLDGPLRTSRCLVAGPGLRQYHLVGCPLAAGRDWPDGTREDHEATGHRPCEVCRP